MKYYIFIMAALLMAGHLSAQTGNLRGKVLDKLTEQPLDGAAIWVNGLDNKYGVTDDKGNFTIDDIPIGRYTLKVSSIGYEETNVTDVVVTTGKDVMVSILLNEKFDKLNEVVVVAEITKNKPLNKMAAVSARQFTMEEVGRYAGGRSDVAKLVSNFAGVAASNDATNVIVVRGNSSTGMLWRIEGVPVPSPNHFSQYGTTGSPISALNPNLIANSDFFLGAFPAEYGNALSGVFDIGYRKGNTENIEYTASLGAFPGAEFMMEGPLGKKEGSFVASARYGVAGLIGAGGTGSAQPNYYDLSFNLDFGNTRLGNFSLFGIGGSSNIEFLGKDADDKDLFSAKDADSESISGFGVLGLKHNIGLSDNTHLKTIVSSSLSTDKYVEDRYYGLNTPQEAKLKYTDADNKESRMALNTTLDSKFSSSLFLRTGFLWEHFINDAS